MNRKNQKTHQVQGPPDQVVPHAGAVLAAAAADEDDAVLLDVVALAGDVGRDDAAAREAHAGRLALARVGLLGPRDADLEAHALELGGADLREGRGDGVARALGLAAALYRWGRVVG